MHMLVVYMINNFVNNMHMLVVYKIVNHFMFENNVPILKGYVSNEHILITCYM